MTYSPPPSEEEELDDEAIAQRRELMRERARQKAMEEVADSVAIDMASLGGHQDVRLCVEKNTIAHSFSSYRGSSFGPPKLGENAKVRNILPNLWHYTCSSAKI